MKQFKSSKPIINQLVAATLISSFLLTTSAWAVPNYNDQRIEDKQIEEESESFNSVVKIGLSPKHATPRKVNFKIDNITDSDNGNVINDIKASFLDVTDNKGKVIGIEPFDDELDVIKEIEIDESSRQVRLNITCTKAILNSISRLKQGFIINLTAHSICDELYTDIEQKISIPINIHNGNLIRGIFTNDGQPCDGINILNWNYNHKVHYIEAATAFGALVCSACCICCMMFHRKNNIINALNKRVNALEATKNRRGNEIQVQRGALAALRAALLRIFNHQGGQ